MIPEVVFMLNLEMKERSALGDCFVKHDRYFCNKCTYNHSTLNVII